jgi:hypothetical protein
VEVYGASLRGENWENSNHAISMSIVQLPAQQVSSAGWVQRGADIDGEAPGDESGFLALSADGAILAVGAPYNAGNGAGSGHVRVYEWSSTGWVQRGADIDGEAPGEKMDGQLRSARTARSSP